MSFEAELLTQLGGVQDAFDIKVSLRRAYHYDFDGSPVRLWDGQGVLVDTSGAQWIGTINADGVNAHSVPRLQDPRDGASPRYTFGLPYIDAATFAALKADQWRAKGRELTIYHAIFLRGEGLLPKTPLRFAWRLMMQGVEFDENVAEVSPGKVVRTYAGSVICRSLEYGRSNFPGGTYTDTSQNERAALLGLASDSGCVFVAGNSGRTYLVD